MKIEFVQGAQADLLLGDESFIAQWSALWERCPWATTFQMPGYARTWYRVYRQSYEPVLILSRDAEGQLQGLLSMAVSAANGRLVGVGDFQAEYQVWICAPEFADSFPLRALEEIRRHMPKAVLRFHYLPPQTPLNWLKDAGIKRLFLLKPHRRPLVRFGDGHEIAASFAKRSNKNRLRQMEKTGHVELKHITNPAEMESIIDSIIPFHDVRHMAFRGAAPFQNDPKRKAFALGLMKEPGVLHVSVLKAGDQIACAHLGGRSKNEVQFGMVAYNPWFAKYSPGKFQILFLSQMLMQQGFAQLDLTAGGDPYKERFADAWDEVHTLTLFPSPLKRAAGLVHRGIERLARKTLQLMRLSPNDARMKASKLKEAFRIASITKMFRNRLAWIASARETRIYSFQASRATEPSAPSLIRRDAPDDLLQYHPTRRGPSRQKFVSDAIDRMEDSQHLYTRAQNNRLIHYAWLAERPSEELTSKLLPGFTLPPETALILEYHTIDRAQAHSIDPLSLQTMLRDAAQVPKTQRIFITISAARPADKALVEQLGFIYEGSLFEQTRFGRRRQWSIIPEDRKTAPPPPKPAKKQKKELAEVQSA